MKFDIPKERRKGNGKFLDEQLSMMKSLAEGKVEIIKL